MTNLDLQPNEGVIIQTDEIVNGELVLTNINIIHINHKGIFGNKKHVQKFPVNQIKVVDGQAQVILKNKNLSYSQVEIFFKNGQEIFEFYKKKEALKWIDAISKMLTGESSKNLQNQNGMAIPGVDQIAGTVKDTIGVFKNALGMKPKKGGVSENITSKCIGCMAPISGRKGETVRCKYCDTNQTL